MADTGRNANRNRRQSTRGAARPARGTPKRIAIACQGGGAQTAFTAGALEAIIGARRRAAKAAGDDGEFEIVALSGASGGAVCAALGWFDLLSPLRGKAFDSRLRRFWKSSYPNGIAAETIPDALQADIRAMMEQGQWPWRRTLDSMRADFSDWALHQDFPSPWLPIQISARPRPYYFDSLFGWLDGAPGAEALRETLRQTRAGAVEALAGAAPGAPAPQAGWPLSAFSNQTLAKLIDDAFELNPFLPESDLRREFDALDAFRGLIERAFAEDVAALSERLEQNPGEPVTELLVGAADVNRTVKLEDDEVGSDAIATNFKVFRASQNLERLTDMLLASGAMPELMRAVELDGDHFWDGAFSQNPPILDLPDVHGPTYPDAPLESGGSRHPEEIWLILVNPATRPDTPRDLAAIDDRKSELSGNIALSNDVHAIRKMNGVRSLCPQSGKTRLYETIRFRAIEMTEPTKLSLELPSKLDRRRINIDPLYAEGYAQAERFLKEWRAEQRPPAPKKRSSRMNAAE